MATLVKRSDAPLYRVFVGDDWKLFAWSLSHEQCFEVSVVLHNPFTTPDAQDKVTAAVCCFGIVLKKNNWFEASQDQAMQVLAATLVPEQSCVDASCNALDLPAPKKRRAKCPPFVDECAPPVAEPTPVVPPAEETDASSAPDSPESCVIPDATDAMSDDKILCGNMWSRALRERRQKQLSCALHWKRNAVKKSQKAFWPMSNQLSRKTHVARKTGFSSWVDLL